VTARELLVALRDELRSELTARILPFWKDHVPDETSGGFIGLIDDDGTVHHDAPKGGIINARILWTFSAAWRVLDDECWAAMATRAERYFSERFIDPVHGGVYWMLDAAGTPIDDRKHVYAQAFAIYALSEHHRASGSEASLEGAVQLFRLIERHAGDSMHGGYHEAFSRDWRLLEDARLSEQDAPEPKSMNTHLHVLEAYASLLRIWPDPLLRRRLDELLRLFLDRIVAPAGDHVVCFFDDDWTPKSPLVSYGHDIESSWLLVEAAEVLGDALLQERVRDVSLSIASAVLARGTDPRGGLYNEGTVSGPTDTDKEWWPQAEAIVGFVAAYQNGEDARFLEAAWQTWQFTRRHFLDAKHGEWHRRVAADGTLRPGHEKVGPWKCPYHTGRACLEVMARVGVPGAAAVER
jgi:mannobiose 2-epimerase